MLDLFKKKGQKKEKELTPIDVLERKYLTNLGEYIEFNEKYFKEYDIDGSEERLNKLMQEYNGAVSEIVNYLLNKFPESSFNANSPLEIEVSDMFENLSDFTFNMLKIPKYPGIVDVLRGTYSTHFHTEGNKVVEAEEVQVLPGLLPSLQNQKINNLFTGLTIKETRDLLKQMRILPITNDLDKVITAYDERNKIYNNFLRSIIYSLLSKATNLADIKRARLFAASFDINFNFEPFENLVTPDQKLKLD